MTDKKLMKQKKLQVTIIFAIAFAVLFIVSCIGMTVILLAVKGDRGGEQDSVISCKFSDFS